MGGCGQEEGSIARLRAVDRKREVLLDLELFLIRLCFNYNDF